MGLARAGVVEADWKGSTVCQGTGHIHSYKLLVVEEDLSRVSSFQGGSVRWVDQSLDVEHSR